MHRVAQSQWRKSQEVIGWYPSRQDALPPHGVRSRHTQEEVRAAIRVRVRGGRGGSGLEDLRQVPVVGAAVGEVGRDRREAFGREMEHARIAACS